MIILNIGAMLLWTQIVCGAFFMVIVFAQMLRFKKDIAAFRILAYLTFGAVVGGVAFGKYYAHIAPKHLSAVEASKPQEVVSSYTEAIRYSPSDAELFFGRGHAKFYLFDYLGAIRDFTSALERSPNNPKYLASRALAFIHMGDLASAENDIHLAIETKERIPELQLAQAIVSVANKQYADAIDKLNAALSSNKVFDPETKCMALEARGLSFEILQEHAKAVEDLKEAVPFCNKNKLKSIALGNLARQYSRMNRVDLALEALKKAEELDPNNVAIYWNRANLFRRNGRSDLELDNLTRYLQLSPNDAIAYMRRAELLEQMNATESALRDRNKAKELINTKRDRPYSSWPFESSRYPFLMPINPQ